MGDNFILLTSKDGTKRLDFKEGYTAVIIPSKDEKYTICISCQIGCPVGCKFCYTGRQGFKKNLSSEKIIEQVVIAQKVIGKKPQSIVFMGMGEPTLNLSNVLLAAKFFHDKLNIAYNHITISTSCLRTLSSLERVPFNVALSLHSPFNKIRQELIPGAVSLREILFFCKSYLKNSSKKKYVMIEYSMIKGINDQEKDLKKLISFKWPKNMLFNLIEFNDMAPFSKSEQERMIYFKNKIIKAGWKCFIRSSRGADIGAACGMLDLS